MSVEVRIQQQARKSLAMRIIPQGVMVLLPREVDPEDERARAFIEAGLARFPAPESPGKPLDRAALQALVNVWAEKMGATVERVRVRAMRRKWASFSSQGTLTLARDLLALPVDLVEYVICHESLHSRFPDHGKGFQAMLTSWMPDWRERERRLMAQCVTAGGKPTI